MPIVRGPQAEADAIEAQRTHNSDADPIDVGDFPWTMPLIGQVTENDHGKIAAFISGMAIENAEPRSPYIELADISRNFFAYGDDPAPPVNTDKVISQEIQDDVIAITDVQTRTPPRCKLKLVAKKTDCLYFWNGGALMPQPVMHPTGTAIVGMQTPFGLMPEQIPQPGQAEPPAPLSPEQAYQIKQQIRAGMLPRESLVEHSDDTVTERYQTALDILWNRSEADTKFRRNLLRTNVDGTSFMLFNGLDRERMRYMLRKLSIKQVYVDTTEEFIGDMNQAGFDFYTDAGEIKRLYPEYRPFIDKYAFTGTPKVPSDSSAAIPEAFNRFFRRPTITLRVWWLRNQPVALTPDEAMETGKVSVTQVPVVQEASDDNTAGMGSGLRAGQPNGNGEAGPVNQGESPEQLPIPEPAPAPQLRQAFILTDSNEETHPPYRDETAGKWVNHPKWPVRYCTRQFTLAVAVGGTAGVVIGDEESRFWDGIPLLHNTCIPVPDVPYGQGEPWRLRQMQRGHTRSLTSMVEHVEFFSHPAVFMSDSMAESMKERYGNAYIRPDRTIRVPDDQWNASGGNVDRVVKPPDLSQGVVQVQQILAQRMSNDSGHTDAIKGEKQAGESGRSLALRMQASSSQIGFKAQATADMIGRAGRLMHHANLWELEPADLARMLPQVPEWLVPMTVQRGRELEWDCDVMMTVLTEEAKIVSEQQAAEDLQRGAISMKTYRDVRQIDDEEESAQIEKEMKERAELMPQEPDADEQEQEQQKGPQNAIGQ